MTNALPGLEPTGVEVLDNADDVDDVEGSVENPEDNDKNVNKDNKVIEGFWDTEVGVHMRKYLRHISEDFALEDFTAYMQLCAEMEKAGPSSDFLTSHYILRNYPINDSHEDYEGKRFRHEEFLDFIVEQQSRLLGYYRKYGGRLDIDSFAMLSALYVGYSALRVTAISWGYEYNYNLTHGLPQFTQSSNQKAFVRMAEYLISMEGSDRRKEMVENGCDTGLIDEQLGYAFSMNYIYNPLEKTLLRSYLGIEENRVLDNVLTPPT